MTPEKLQSMLGPDLLDQIDFDTVVARQINDDGIAHYRVTINNVAGELAITENGYTFNPFDKNSAASIYSRYI